MLEGEGGAQLELSSLSLDQAANYTCAAVNTAGLGEAEAFQLEIYGMSTDQITIKTLNRKCRLHWRLIDFIDWSGDTVSQVGVFDPFCELAPLRRSPYSLQKFNPVFWYKN